MKVTPGEDLDYDLGDDNGLFSYESLKMSQGDTVLWEKTESVDSNRYITPQTGGEVYYWKVIKNSDLERREYLEAFHHEENSKVKISLAQNVQSNKNGQIVSEYTE